MWPGINSGLRDWFCLRKAAAAAANRTDELNELSTSLFFVFGRFCLTTLPEELKTK